MKLPAITKLNAHVKVRQVYVIYVNPLLQLC